MKAIKCKLVMNTASGRCTEPMEFPSVSKAVAFAKDSFYFRYRIFNENNKLIKEGFCG